MAAERSPLIAEPHSSPLFHVVLHEPEIPNNTGNIGRTCVATACRLHLIHPLGFSLDEKARRRAGLDYWPRVDLREHESWGAYLASEAGARLWLCTTRCERTVYEADFRAGDHLVFGKETRGLPREILETHADRAITLPMVPGERSLNLATAVSAAIYVAMGIAIGASRGGARAPGTNLDKAAVMGEARRRLGWADTGG